MPHRLTFEYNPLSYEYPDDESNKELFLQATTKIVAPTSTSTHAPHQLQHPHPYFRDVLLYWVNVVFNDGEEVWQVVRLDERDNVHRYVYPDLIVVDECERLHNQTFSLGIFNRDQREAILECADDVEYDARPGPGTKEGQCLRWMSQLLECMVQEGLVGRGVVEAIRDAVPLPPVPGS